MSTIQNYPTTDSVPIDPFEGLVATYYQLKGYITSSNKWFWFWEEGKKQRGYQDIDVLAINDTETVIVSVTANLDDKVRYTRQGVLRRDMLDKLNDHFGRVKAYLAAVPEYAWLVSGGRKVRKVVAFGSGDRLADRIRDQVGDIELLYMRDVIQDLQTTTTEYAQYGLRTNVQTIKLMHLLGHYGLLEQPEVTE